MTDFKMAGLSDRGSEDWLPGPTQGPKGGRGATASQLCRKERPSASSQGGWMGIHGVCRLQVCIQ